MGKYTEKTKSSLKSQIREKLLFHKKTFEKFCEIKIKL